MGVAPKFKSDMAVNSIPPSVRIVLSKGQAAGRGETGWSNAVAGDAVAVQLRVDLLQTAYSIQRVTWVSTRGKRGRNSLSTAAAAVCVCVCVPTPSLHLPTPSLQKFGGNVDNRRIGKGGVMYYPVEVRD